MTTTSGTSSHGVLPFPAPTSQTPNAPTSTPDDNDNQSFADVMHQHGADDTTRPTAKDNSSSQPADKTSTTPTTPADHGVNTTKDAAATATETAPTKDIVKAIAPTKSDTKSKTGLAPTSDLVAMIIQASVLASNAPQPAATPTATTADPVASTKSATTAAPGDMDLTKLIAQASFATAAATTTASTTDTATKTPATSATATTTDIAATTASLGKEIPLPVSTKDAGTVPTREKKSAATTGERTFIQSDAATQSTTSNPLTTIVAPVATNSDGSGNQHLPTPSDARKSLVNSLAPAASGTAGTANGERDAAMNTSLHMTQLTATATPTQSQADTHIQLASNDDFNRALKQVLNVTSLGEASVRAPMRVAMELHTPPGAVVNVYISKQADGYRAQLSTNDSQALSWVQNKLSELRQSNDVGVNVRWLPAQMETNTVGGTSHNGNDGLGWEQGGNNNQQNFQQQQDERQDSRQKRGDLFPGMPSLPEDFFSTAFANLGRAS